ncbi:MAG: MBL fold metallo-hydrolase [Deltaproteobacteria bacterium]|nr:MBL fold metallo-hydrolase [Deltaproteobacteria bacterium]
MRLFGQLFSYPWRRLTENNCNSYLLDGRPRTLVDPGHAHLFNTLSLQMKEDGFSPESIDLIVLTHCHPDHLEAAAGFFPAATLVTMHEAEETYMMGDGKAFFEAMGGRMPKLEMKFLLREGSLQLGDHHLEVIHAPGHSPGSICLYWPRYKTLITGDLVFLQGVGRMDFPGGRTDRLKESIVKVAELDLETVLPGHGEIIQGEKEVRDNFEFIQSIYFPVI